MASGPVIYILGVEKEDLYKVGKTVDVARRLKELNTGSCKKLEVLRAFPVPKDHAGKCESFVHASLQDLAAKEAGGTEFFRCADRELFFSKVLKACQHFAELLRRISGVLEEGDPRVAQLFAERKELSSSLKQLQVKSSVLDEALKSNFKEGVSVEGIPALSWKKIQSKSFDLDAFRKDHPELAAQYTVTRVGRVAVFS